MPNRVSRGAGKPGMLPAGDPGERARTSAGNHGQAAQLIVATAGHVDHGKTSLVKLLTGTDTDRLEEERRRGLSIDLGFAYLKTAAGRSIGFIDVPGHRRFLNNMIAGISGIDAGLLVVDAGEGVMPQTLEHLTVMRLLGVEDHVVAITKIDRADPAGTRAAGEAVRALLPHARVVAVSSVTGAGKTELLAALDELAERHGQREARGRFRLSVDRAFVLQGAGLVVTGTAASGAVAVGDSLQLFTSRSPANGVKVRVRSLHVNGEPAPAGRAGQRCALNLVGDVHWKDVERGDRLIASGCAAPGLRFDAAVNLLADVTRPLQHLQPVKLYHGAGRLRARAFFLDGAPAADARPEAARAAAGQRLVQFILERELPVSWGDRFLVQDDGETTLLAGGTVLAPNAPQRRRTRPPRLQYLEAMTLGDPARALERLLLEDAQFVDFVEFRRSLNLRDDEADALATDPRFAEAVVRLKNGTDDWLLPRQRWNETMAAIYAAVRHWHATHPTAEGIGTDALFAPVSKTLSRALFMATLDALVRQGSLVVANGLVKSRDHRPSAVPQLQQAWQRLHGFLIQGGFRIPLFSEIDRDLGLGTKVRMAVVGSALKAGRVRQVSAKRVALPATLRQIAAEINALAERSGSFSVIEAKEQLGLGRDLTIELLEFFDSVRFTRRRDNGREVIDKGLPERLFASHEAQGAGRSADPAQ